MKRQLPSRPNLEQLKHQAKDLLKSHKLGEPEAIQRIQKNHPRWAKASAAEIRAARFSLSHAQLVIAREFGFAGWPELKARVDSLALERGDPIELFKQAAAADDAALVRELLERHPELKAKINDPVASFDAPVITTVRSRRMLDVLLAAGADINAKSRWWAGGFGLLHGANPDLAAYAIGRGAVVDVHAAARLGMIERLRALISANSELVNARGGDGQTPLHFASTIAVAEYLLDHGADIEARDVDHESTPAQYMVRDRQEVLRYLIQRGCKTDLLMAAALGNADLVRKHLDADPDCIRHCVSEEFFPKQHARSGGTIYQWALGWFVTAHQVAKQFGHEEVFQLLMERSPADLKLLAACWLGGDDATVKSLLIEQPGLVASLSDAYRRQVAHAARNNNLAAVRLMLAAGLPVGATGQHGGTPLHWAAWHGNAEMARVILRYNPPLEQPSTDFHATPLGWAINGSEDGWYRQTGDYPATVEALIQAGAKLPKKIDGSDAVRAVLRRYGVQE
jgi:ankyrin repeat protein